MNNAPTQLEFTQAMTDFKVMFPDMDADVIEAVLRANNGAVDTTIDHLLAMSADNESKPSEQDLPPSMPPAYTGQPPSYQQATNEAVTDDLINLGATGGDVLPEKKELEPSMDLLMSDFEKLGLAGATAMSNPANVPSSSSDVSELKYGGSPKHAYSHPKRQEQEESKASSSNPNMLPTQQQLHEIYEENLRLREESKGNVAKNQYLEDERIALMLQNEEFMAELQRDSEFMSALEMEQVCSFIKIGEQWRIFFNKWNFFTGACLL